MSDHEEMSLNSGYSTPVPELDDHTHQSSSVQKSRSRRGTVETIHYANASHQQTLSPGLAAVNERLAPIIARQFEEAVEDDEGQTVFPLPVRPSQRSRRGTFATIDRDISPPNSVKAFADARRRERGQSFVSDPTSVKAFADARRHDDCELQRTTTSDSRRSRRSARSRRYTNENDVASLAGSAKSAEEDVCFPMHPEENKDTLQINFELLEDFIADEEVRDKTPPKGQPQARIFQDLRPQHQPNKSHTFTSGGEFIDIPSFDSSEFNEKTTEKEAEQESVEEPLRHENRFEFFSSAGESTIHAAEFGDLVLPGDDVRTLFTMPPGEDEDGVWWLNMNNPSEEEIRVICKAFGVHPLTIEDIGTQEAREKIELFPAYYFACFRSFAIEEHEEGQRFEPFNIYVVVFREGTLSFSFSPNPHAAHVRKRITMLKNYVSLSSDWICYALM